MPASALARHIESRLNLAKVIAPASLLDSLTAYLELLARWNQKINLTAFDLTAPSDAAIDRLIVEPVEAARLVRPEDRCTIDIGSGGGSPALPLTLAAPWIQMTLIEARTRKSAFLREAVRVLELKNVDVETSRFDVDSLPARFKGAVDLVTVRGVKLDDEVLEVIDRVSSAAGRLLYFGRLGINQNTDGSSESRWKSEIFPLEVGTVITALSKVSE